MNKSIIGHGYLSVFLILLSCQVTTMDKPALSSKKEITYFGFSSLAISGEINELDRTIWVTVPFGTTLNALTPTLKHTGKTVEPNPDMPQDFSNSINYSITAENLSTKTYIVSVVVSPFIPISSLQISPLPLMNIGEQSTMTYSITPSNASDKTIQLQSSDSKVVEIIGNTAFARGNGKVTITASSSTSKISNATECTVYKIVSLGGILTSDLTVNSYERLLTTSKVQIASGVTLRFSGNSIIDNNGWNRYEGHNIVLIESLGRIETVCQPTESILADRLYITAIGPNNGVVLRYIKADAVIVNYGEYTGSSLNGVIENCTVNRLSSSNYNGTSGSMSIKYNKVLNGANFQFREFPNISIQYNYLGGSLTLRGLKDFHYNTLTLFPFDKYTLGPIDMTLNYWSTTDDLLIQNCIYDKNDDLTASDYVLYKPYLVQPDPLTPIP